MPVYVVDQDRKVVFCNEPCAEWLGVPTEDLVGQQCNYHSSPDCAADVAAAAALCPPPESLAGEASVAMLVSPRVDESRPTREAHFLPLGDTPASCVGVIAVVQEDPTAQTDVESWPAQLHTLLAESCRSRSKNYAIHRLAGRSPARRRVRDQIDLAATSNANVLIVGERGSGRQHVARTIHELSNGDARLVPLDCVVAPTGLLEHLVSRVSDAGRGSAERDILLLVEIDQLAPDAQATLAGQLDADDFPYRVIATSTEPLGLLATQGRFREDLAFRLAVLTIDLPKLADLGNDLPLLAQWYLEAENARGGKQLAGFAARAMEMLLSHQWPGNVSELAEVVRAAHHAADGPRVEPADLPAHLRLAADAAIQGTSDESPIDLEAFLADIELRLVRRALEAADGNKSHAAKMLGMTRQRLYRRLVQLGLEKPEEKPE